MRKLLQIMLFVFVLLCWTTPASADQFPQSVICQFEKIATAELDSNGKLITGSEISKGEMVISNLNSDTPLGSGNIGAVKLQVLKRSKDTIWLAEITPNEVAGVITLFFKTGVVMYTKHETLHTLANADIPFGFVEIGRFRPLK
jgi:hypothetical protein